MSCYDNGNIRCGCPDGNCNRVPECFHSYDYTQESLRYFKEHGDNGWKEHMIAWMVLHECKHKV